MTTIDQSHAPFAMPELPWAHNALAPYISAETIDYHYGKHLQGYVNNLNNLVKDTAFEKTSLEEIIRKTAGDKSHAAIFNNASQTWNHTLYFMSLSPNPKTRPEGRLAEAINRDFGSFDAFVEQFTKAAMGLFGSGWVWLAANESGEIKNGTLEIVSSPNAGNPITDGKRPLMVIDVWEHAYYIDYRNIRADSVKAFRNILDWKVAEERY